eukprot:gene42538-52755_t
MSNKGDIDSIVKEYLLARGYSKAAAELDQESSVVLENPTINSTAENKELTQRILSTMATIANETSHLAKRFWDTWSPDFIEFYSDELTSLSSLTSREMMKSPEFLA